MKYVPCLILAMLPSTIVRGDDIVTLSVEIIRVRANISGETSLTDDIGAGLGKPALGAVKGRFVFFTLAKLDIGGVKLEANEKGWSWSGKRSAPRKGEVTGIETLAAPRVTSAIGQTFDLSIVAVEPVEYFEKRADGLFELKRVEDRPGLFFTGRSEPGPNGRVVLRDLELRLRAVEKREPIDGCSLNVGKPRFKDEELKTSLSLQPGRDYGIQYRTASDGILMLRVRVERVKEKEMEK